MKRGFHEPSSFGHLRLVDVLVGMLRVVGSEELGELLPGVVDELAH